MFYNNSNVPQAPIEEQLAVTLFRMGRYGNGASMKDIARQVGCSEGSFENFTSRCFTAKVTNLHGQTWPTCAIHAPFPFTANPHHLSAGTPYSTLWSLISVYAQSTAWGHSRDSGNVHVDYRSQSTTTMSMLQLASGLQLLSSCITLALTLKANRLWIHLLQQELEVERRHLGTLQKTRALRRKCEQLIDKLIVYCLL